MSDDNWTPWEYRLPPIDQEVEWRRRDWDKPSFVAAWNSFPPEFNVAGLSWRPLSARLKELGLA